MATQRGICPVCGEERAVTTKGRIRQHFVVCEYGWRLADECAGTRQPPKIIVADPIAAAEQRGYQRAIADLRNLAAAHLKVAPDGPSFDAYDIAADGLEALATQPTDTTET